MQFLSDNAAAVHPQVWEAMRAADAADTPYDTDRLSGELEIRGETREVSALGRFARVPAYLDGRERYARRGAPTVESRWRPETAENPTFYQAPYGCLLPRGLPATSLPAGGCWMQTRAHSPPSE